MPQACLLALVAGYADAVGFLKYDAFAGLMTGNTILFGIAVSNAHFSAALFITFAIIAVFLTGVILARIFLRLGGKPWLPLSVVSALLVLCGFLSKDIAAPTLALAMGLQNSAANRFDGVSLNTVFITGNLQKLGEGILAWAWPQNGETSDNNNVAIFGLVWIAYAIGAGIGATSFRYLTYPLLVPAAVLPFIMLRIGKGALVFGSARWKREANP